MTINPESVRQIVQAVNEKMDESPGVFNQDMGTVIRTALDKLSQIPLVNCIDSLSLTALSSRISTLSQSPDVAFGRVDGYLAEDLSMFSREFFAKANEINLPPYSKEEFLKYSKDESVLFLAMPLIKKTLSNNDVEIVLREVAVIPQERREAVCVAALRFIRESMNGREIVDILRVLVTIPEEKLEAVFSFATCFIKESISGYETSGILYLIGRIAEEKRESVCIAALRFIKESMRGNEIVDVLSAVIAIADESREAVCNAAGLCIKEYMSGYEIVAILKGIEAIAEESRKSTCIEASHLITEDMNSNYINRILKAVAGIAQEKRGAVCMAAKHFTKKSMGGSEVAVILEAIAKIPDESREFVCSIADFLIKENTSTAERTWILDCLQKIPPQNKEKIVRNLRKVEEYGNKQIGSFLQKCLLRNGDCLGYGDALVLLADEALVAHKILPSIVPARWIADVRKENPSFGKSDKTVSCLIDFLGRSKTAFKDVASRLMQPYLLVTLALDKSSGLTSLRKLQLLSSICEQEERVKGLGLLRALCARKEESALARISLEDPIETLTVALEESLIRDRFIDLSGIENLGNSYFSSFANTRIPFALETYMAGLRNFNETVVNKTLERFVRSVLLETFEVERYDTTKSPHLKKIQDYDVEMGKTVLEDWKRLNFKAEVLSEAIPAQEKKFSFEGFFKEKLGDGHAIKDEEDMLPELSSFFKEALEKRADFLGNHKRTVLGMQALIKTETDSEKRKTIALALKLAQAELSCMELVLNVGLSKEEQTKKMQAVSASLSSLDLEIAADLGGLARMFKEPEVSHSLETVELCKGWEDLFLAGSEVEGSCQRINGNPDLNKCLLAYCLDGKNAMVAVKDPGGKLLARSMLRLLWDAAENKPVLFLDRLYPSPCSRERESSIQMASIACARTLGVELFTKGTVSSWTGKTIESLGSSCPFEYADASDGVMTKGVFTIRNPQKIKTSI